MEACTVVLVPRKNPKYKWTSSENEQQGTMYVQIACPQISSTIIAQSKTILKSQYHQNLYFPELVTPHSPLIIIISSFLRVQNVCFWLVSTTLTTKFSLVLLISATPSVTVLRRFNARLVSSCQEYRKNQNQLINEVGWLL